MQKTLTLPSTEYLHACFDYEHATGKLRWKRRPSHHFASIKEWKRWNSRFAGSIAGQKQRHCRIRIGDNTYAGHRIVWKWMTGNEPPANIDHKNCDGYDNRWANLREADQTKQNWNKNLQKNNLSGYRGVSRDRGGKWRAVIQANRTQRYLGLFLTAQEAAAAYEAVARELHGDFYHRR